jgi:type II secretory pathway pseudopilin PulG
MELMVIVGILGILAATAIPWYQRFQLRTKAAECKSNLAALRSAESSYFSEYGNFIMVAPVPGGLATTTKRAWPICAAPITMASPGQCILGYRPEGPTYYTYGVRNTTGVNGGLGNISYLADALSDIDGDGRPNIWGIDVPPQNVMVPTGLVGVNGCTTVFDPLGNPNLLRQVGPCGIGDGSSVF